MVVVSVKKKDEQGNPRTLDARPSDPPTGHEGDPRARAG